MSNQRFVLLAFVVAALLLGVMVQSATVSGFEQFAVPDNRLLGLVNTSTALSVGSAAACFGVLIRNRAAMTFTSGVISELEQVTWPTRNETVRASTTVVLTTLFTAALLAFYDLIWKSLADLILFTES